MIKTKRNRGLGEISRQLRDRVLPAGTLKTLKRFRWHVATAGALLVAAGLRFPDLSKVPLPFADEIVAAVDIHYLIRTGHHFDGAHAGILAYVTPALDGRFAVSFLGGNTVADFRLVAALFGVLTVGLMVWLGHELGAFRIGVLSAGALAIMPWHIYYSRIFLPASEYLFLTVLAICLELAALRKRSMILGIGSALAAGASIYIYPVAIVSTPLLMGSVLAFHWRDVRNFGMRRAVGAAAVFGGVALLPYAFDHLVVTDPAVGTANAVISAKLIWTNGLDVAGVVQQFISSWANYLTPSYILLHGDPNVRQSIQQMGEVGWALGAIALLGIAVGIYRRSRTDLLLITLTAIYPIADALTYSDAPGNSVRGLTGSVIWAVWVAVGAQEALRITVGRGTFSRRHRRRRHRHVQRSYRAALAVAAVAAVGLQSFAFISYYFGPYTVQYAYAFETGYDNIYGSLSSRGLQRVPITLHAGYERDAMLQYFSQYRLHAPDTPLACSDLPYNVVHYTVLPRIFIVREDHDFAATSGCVQQTNLIERDKGALLSVAPQPGEAGRKLDVIAVFPNDPQGDYYTAILYLHD